MPTPVPPERSDLKRRWHAGPPLVGLFARLTDPAAYETLALSSADLVMIDVEHGSFDRATLGQCILAARAGGLPVLVRVVDDALPAIQHAVGAGADGIVVPHVSSPDGMRTCVDFIRGLAVERAYAGATRASQLRRESWPDFQARLAARILAIAQIDEPPGIEAAAGIAAIPGLDGVFLGQIGLALAMAGPADPAPVDEALGRACAACRDRGLPLGLSLTDLSKARHWRERGIGLFVVDSDHTLLLKGANARCSDLRGSLERATPVA